MTYLYRSSSGQSLVELALILPIILALAGAATDLARAYQAQLTLESATRNAAEYVAAASTDGLNALSDARRIVCVEARQLPGFTSGTGPAGDSTCLAPNVTVDGFSVSASAPGGTSKNPVGSVRVHAFLDFRTLLPYPFLPTRLSLSADSSFTVVRGR